MNGIGAQVQGEPQGDPEGGASHAQTSGDGGGQARDNTQAAAGAEPAR